MSYLMLSPFERILTPCLFVPQWSVANCDHAICGNRIARRQHQKRKDEAVNKDPA